MEGLAFIAVTREQRFMMGLEKLNTVNGSLVQLTTGPIEESRNSHNFAQRMRSRQRRGLRWASVGETAPDMAVRHPSSFPH